MSQRGIKNGDRRRINKAARRADNLFTPITNAIGDGILTPAEVCRALPSVPQKDVRLALRLLADEGRLIRVSDATAVLYARAER